MSLGGKFFVIQLCSLLTIGTTNFIISNSLGASDVVTYNLVYKYFSFTTISFTIITSSLYSSISEAFHMGDLQWIRNAIKKSNYISYIILACIFVMCLFMDQVFKIWLGKDLEINNSIKILMAIYFSMLLFVSTYSTFVSSIGKIKIAFYFSVFNSVLTIPLSIYLAKKIGLNGIILVQIILAAPGLYWLPVQYYKIMQGKAKGIWNI
jgi:O-antigen/teichoic acid export membrane protein